MVSCTGNIWKSNSSIMSSRKAFIETYCDGNKENRTQGLANKIESICKHAAGARSKKSPSLKSFLTYFS